MAQPGVENPFRGVSSELFDSVRTFDEKSYILYDYLALTAKRQPDSERYSVEVAHCTEVLNLSFGNVLAKLNKGAGEEWPLGSITTIWHRDEEIRRIMLRQVTHQDWPGLTRDELHRLAKNTFAAAADPADRYGAVHDMYAFRLANDVSEFGTFLEARRPATSVAEVGKAAVTLTALLVTDELMSGLSRWLGRKRAA